MDEQHEGDKILHQDAVEDVIEEVLASQSSGSGVPTTLARCFVVPDDPCVLTDGVAAPIPLAILDAPVAGFTLGTINIPNDCLVAPTDMIVTVSAKFDVGFGGVISDGWYLIVPSIDWDNIDVDGPSLFYTDGLHRVTVPTAVTFFCPEGGKIALVLQQTTGGNLAFYVDNMAAGAYVQQIA